MKETPNERKKEGYPEERKKEERMNGGGELKIIICSSNISFFSDFRL